MFQFHVFWCCGKSIREILWCKSILTELSRTCVALGSPLLCFYCAVFLRKVPDSFTDTGEHLQTSREAFPAHIPTLCFLPLPFVSQWGISQAISGTVVVGWYSPVPSRGWTKAVSPSLIPPEPRTCCCCLVCGGEGGERLPFLLVLPSLRTSFGVNSPHLVAKSETASGFILIRRFTDDWKVILSQLDFSCAWCNAACGVRYN